MDMNTMTLPRKGLKKYDYNIDMEKKDLKKLTKGQLIKLLSKKVSNHEDLLDNDPFKDEVAQEPTKPRTGKWESIKPKPVPRKSVNEDIILPPPKGFRDRPPKPTRKPNDDFNFDDDIFQTENTSLGNFKIISVQSRENEKFKRYTNDFKVKILKKLDDVKEIYHIFQELVKTVKRRRKLSDNDMLRLVIQNEELPNAISTKFNKVENFKLGDLENVINILEYRAIPIEKCKIVVQSVKIATGKGRLYLTKDTVSRKDCIITVKNGTICLARAIVTAHANLRPERWSNTELKNGFNSSRKLQRLQAMKLHEDAHVEINDYGNDLSDIETFAKHLDIEINVIDAEQFNNITYTANKCSEDKIYLLKTKNHFDVIKSLTAFYDAPYYCHECKKTYTKRDKHKCPSKCLSCFTYTKDKKCEGNEIICSKCNRKFFGKRCFKNHLKNRSKVEGKTDIICDTVKKCNDCSRIITGKYVNCHKCGYSECTNCGKYVGKDHKCYLKKVKAKGGNCMTGKKEPCKNNDSIKKTDWCYPCRTYTEKYIFYDFEATQNTGTHTVNLSIAQDFEGKEYIHNSIDEFCKGFLNDKFKGYTFIAHNSKGYDSHFVLKWLIDQGIKPYCIYNGAKIMFMEIPKLSIRFIDSLNFLQMPLKSFRKTFGMSELKKGYFPHYFNKECNKDYVGTMPSKKHYGYNQMKLDEKSKFLKWYEEHESENYVFDFKKEILEYCRSDVDILRRGIMKLREDFIQLENINPLRYIMIASVCMTIYRSNYMPKKTIAIVPEYAITDNFSKMSIMWLNYVSNGADIKHALNGGEKKLTINDKTYKVDGFCEETNTVYEFYGCFWHGHPKCYKANIVNSKNQKDMGTLNGLTVEKCDTIKNAGYNHVSTYECQLTKNKEFQKFAKNFTQEIVEPLNPRDVFYGGWTNATKLLYNSKDNECGRYVDFCSLYPTVQYYKKYSIGHPTKIFNPEKHDKSWYGLIKCKVVPPKGLYHPILPQRIKVDSYEKLVFTLCKACAESRNQNECEYTDAKRSFIGTWTTDEVNKALEKGYKVIKTYEVWHFDGSTDDLFKGYIRRFMKIKLESSKYDFKTKEEESNFKLKIKKSLDIDIEKFEFNAGLRSISKLCLNSLWGKVAQKSNMSQTKYVTEVSEFYEILLNDKLDNINFQFINDDMVQKTYNFKDQFVDNSKNTNVYIACFTTSHARLMLYNKLDYLNEKVLYFDTDSIIYANDGTKNIETGDMLGDMTDELSGKGITNFVSMEPKSYSFKYGDDDEKSAIKGFTLNHENSSILNHNSMSKIVRKQIRELTIVNKNKITRKNREIVNEYHEKVFKFGYDKRVIRQINEDHIDTLPYGY